MNTLQDSPPVLPLPPPRDIEWIQPVRVARRRTTPLRRRRSPGCCAFWAVLIPFIGVAILCAGAYFLAPLRTDFLILGIDRVPEGPSLGRSDTMILVSVNPLKPEVPLFSIPRDLWVSIPGVGENRINTAHFYAEANAAGSGPAAALETVNLNFQVNITYYVRVRFAAFQSIVDTLGGVTVNLPEDRGGLPAGTHHLDGAQALAFVRDRKGVDDFYRMGNGQIMLRAIARQVLSPLTWPRLPAVFAAAAQSIDTNLPAWQWPRLGFALARASLTGFNGQAVTREMVTPYTTEGGAQVLLPNWELILPAVHVIFNP